ncbi:lachesin-like [Halichondria panicea]|uniref:lachesin-like n=1 Tax=Halichondria panicea TaxID=6063 RepID=UPI00312B9350
MLQIIRLQSSDGGVYRCSAVTDLPCTTMQSDETVVNTAPTVSLSPSSNISAVVGDNVEITCDVEGWPTPSLSWRKATTSNTVIEISQNPVLVIDSATTADSEQYSCVADNGFTDQDAIMTQTITITIATVTDPVTLAPTDVTLGAVDSANNLGGPVIRPTENGFYIAIAVTTFVCLFLTGTTIFSVTIWCYKKRKSEREAEYQEEEESNTDLQTIETSLMY